MASEETESPGLDFKNTETYRRVFGGLSNPYIKAFSFRFVNSGNKEQWTNKISSDDFHEGIMMSALYKKIASPAEKIRKVLKRFDQGI